MVIVIGFLLVEMVFLCLVVKFLKYWFKMFVGGVVVGMCLMVVFGCVFCGYLIFWVVLFLMLLFVVYVFDVVVCFCV